MNNPFSLFSPLIITAILVISCSCTAQVSEDEDLPTFFKDKMNIIALFGGLGLVLISTLLSLYLCSAADRRAARAGLLDDDDKDDD